MVARCILSFDLHIRGTYYNFLILIVPVTSASLSIRLKLSTIVILSLRGIFRCDVSVAREHMISSEFSVFSLNRYPLRLFSTLVYNYVLST